MIRDQIVDFLRRELIGPDPVPPNVQENGEEILTSDPPRIRYGAGVLFPRAAAAAIVQDTSPSEAPDAGEVVVPEVEEPQVEIIGENRAADDSFEEAAMEDSIALTNAYLPSAAGFSCFAEIPADGFRLDVSAARYRVSTRVYEVKGEEKRGRQYEREPITTSLTIPTEQLRGPGIRSCRIPVELNGANIGLVVNVVSRPRGKSPAGIDLGLLTVTLINVNESGDGRAENEKCFFQVEMRLAAANAEACFIEYPEREGESLDDEDRSLRLLYRHRKTFAIGHGCAADWVETSGRATLIRTDFLPTYEVKPVVPARFEDLDLSMLGLSDLRDEANGISLLTRLCDRYEEWIEEREAEAATLEGELRETAGRHITNCRSCLVRMRGGVEVLRNDATAMLAFRLANRAMLLQQLHYSIPLREWEAGVAGLPGLAALVPPDILSPTPGKGSWYPFQLAFILINLRSQAVPIDAEREIVDLIWFPTGGGKTEAYLGLTAFTIFLRRLRNPRNGGVTVLMRYTLRLLTAQQFQRAATLICACERIRSELVQQLGGERISIGLWVGMGLTPNKRADAVQAHNKLTRGEGRENPFILLRCPWCSAQMGPVEVGNRRYLKGYEKRRNPSTVVFTCPDAACPFSASGALPLYVIDEDIYAEPPTLLIGTVDKFAMLPWRPEARSLFAVNQGEHAPPDLIIQDELHLISGPLGSMVGHYETVINELCTDRRGGRAVVPKIVASTATICRADEQVGCLYSREVFQFPPQCLRAGDSFFAREDESAPGRLYVGVHASALPSHVTVQVRVFSALLQAAKSAVVEEERDRDPYYTLLAYFNSLRELGHAATLTRADIREYLNAMWLRKEIKGDGRRFIYSALELTSRISSSEIPESLQMLERRYPAGEGEKAVDVCLATNMISVGVDVPRLGLMAVVGQPKTTSEYIQATSRVGRDRNAPGLVVTIYHTGKPRDRSHYEHFRPYHASIYRQVEPTSVTPFAAPVRERALHALVVTLVRYLGNPANMDRPQPFPDAVTLSRIEEVIRQRVCGVDPDEEQLTLELLEDILDQWGRVLPPRYGDFGPPQPELPLMFPAGMHPLESWESKSFPTPSSMRSVDASCEAKVINQYPEPIEG
jgi:hypothetical protein